MASLCQLIECCVVVGSESQSSPAAVLTGCAVRGWIYCFDFFFSDHSVKLDFVSIVHTTELEVSEVLQYIVGLFHRRVCYVELEQHLSDKKAMLLIAASPCRFTVL